MENKTSRLFRYCISSGFRINKLSLTNLQFYRIEVYNKLKQILMVGSNLY